MFVIRLGKNGEPVIPLPDKVQAEVGAYAGDAAVILAGVALPIVAFPKGMKIKNHATVDTDPGPGIACFVTHQQWEVNAFQLSKRRREGVVMVAYGET